MKTCISPVDQFYNEPDQSDSSILRCYAISNSKQFQTFWTTVMPLPSQSSSQEVDKLLELSHHEYEHTMVHVNVSLPVHTHNAPEECRKNRKYHKLNLMFVVPYILLTYVLFKSNWMYNILFSCKVFSSTCFGCYLHPSSGAQL
jgi:hypothetical protein